MLEASWFALVDGLAASESRRRRLRPDDADEFRSHVRLRFAERGERIVAAHDGRSSLETYLHVVVARSFLDWQRTMWGHWRPSVEAARLGTVAVELDRRLNLIGESFESAVAGLTSRFGELTSREALEEIRNRLPGRSRRRQVSDSALEHRAATTESPEEAVNARERADIARRLRPVLRRALRALDPTDRLVLLLVFRDGLSVRAAARAVGFEHKRLARRLDRALGHLRVAMNESGVDRYAALLLLEAPLQDEQGLLEAIGDSEWDNGSRRPSSTEVEP